MFQPELSGQGIGTMISYYIEYSERWIIEIVSLANVCRDVL